MKLLISLLLTCSLLSLHAQFNTFSQSTEATASFQNAIAQNDLGNSILAKGLFIKAIDQDTAFVDAHNQLASLYKKESKIDSAIYHYKQSLKLYPRGLEAHQQLAAAFIMQGDFDAAINQYKELLGHYPDYPEAFYGMALVYFNTDNYVEAIRHSERAMRLYLSGKSYLNAAEARMLAGRACLKKGLGNRALKYFKASKKHFKDESYFPYYLGMAYLAKGQKEKAKKYIRIAELQGFKVPPHVKEKFTTGLASQQ